MKHEAELVTHGNTSGLRGVHRFAVFHLSAYVGMAVCHYVCMFVSYIAAQV